VKSLLVSLLALILTASAEEPNAATAGLLESHTILTVYGRGFSTTPILGMLGTFQDFDELAKGTAETVREIAAVNGGKPVVTGVDLIYAMAVPCQKKGDCLLYLDGGTLDLIETYIKPAAQRGAIVILDTQLGRSDPVAQVRRMIEKGYLKFENVHVAIDPEFHLLPKRRVPGTPIGTVTAQQVNEVQKLLDEYVVSEHLRTKKILIVHQFGDAAVHDGVPYMIRDKKTLATYPNVQLAIDADGLGTPVMKVTKYNLMTNSETYPSVRFRGIKIFYRCPLEKYGHFDKPPMTMKQVFDAAPVPGGPHMAAKPDVVIIA